MPPKRQCADQQSGVRDLPRHILAEVFFHVPAYDLGAVLLTCRAWKEVACGDCRTVAVLGVLRSWHNFPRDALGISTHEISPRNWPPRPPASWLLDDAGLALAHSTLETLKGQAQRYRDRLAKVLKAEKQDGEEPEKSNDGDDEEEEEEEDLPELWKKLAPKFRVGIALDVEKRSGSPQETQLSVGSSKFNGLPDFPVTGPAVVWPRGTENNEPMAMLLQVSCSDLVPVDVFGVFPKRGLLQFWHCQEGQWDGYPVLYHAATADDSELVATPYPGGAPYGIELAVRMRAVLMPPKSLFQDEEYDIDSPLEKYEDVVSDLSCQDESTPTHWLLGNVDPVQDNPVPPGSVLLCQLRSDQDLGFMFGDVGDVYWWLTPEDLASGNWHSVKSDMQCH